MTEPNPFLTRRDGACELWLIRHGDAAPEAGGPIAASYDEQPLNARGRAQAEALAARLIGVSFNGLVCSPLLRCVQTAAPHIAASGLAPQIVPALREITHDGDARPQPGQSAESYIGAFLDGGIRIGAYAMRTGSFDGLPGAEPRAQFRSRVRGALDGLAAQHPGGRIAVYTHGGVINVYAAEVLVLERDFFMPIANTAVSVVRVLGERRMLVSLNDLCHLRGG